MWDGNVELWDRYGMWDGDVGYWNGIVKVEEVEFKGEVIARGGHQCQMLLNVKFCSCEERCLSQAVHFSLPAAALTKLMLVTRKHPHQRSCQYHWSRSYHKQALSQKTTVV